MVSDIGSCNSTHLLWSDKVSAEVLDKTLADLVTFGNRHYLFRFTAQINVISWIFVECKTIVYPLKVDLNWQMVLTQSVAFHIFFCRELVYCALIILFFLFSANHIIKYLYHIIRYTCRSNLDCTSTRWLHFKLRQTNTRTICDCLLKGVPSPWHT